MSRILRCIISIGLAWAATVIQAQLSIEANSVVFNNGAADMVYEGDVRVRGEQISVDAAKLILINTARNNRRLTAFGTAGSAAHMSVQRADDAGNTTNIIVRGQAIEYVAKPKDSWLRVTGNGRIQVDNKVIEAESIYYSLTTKKLEANNNSATHNKKRVKIFISD